MKLLQTEQIFSSPIFDGTAKYILTENKKFRLYILKALSGLNITKADILDDHLNPLDAYYSLRKLLNSQDAKQFFIDVRSNTDDYPDFIKNLAKYSDDLRSAFPLPEKDSQVDFLCETDQGYITIEIQLVKQDYWDARALAYISSLYGNQLKRGGKWGDIKEVIGINLLGEGSVPYWNKTEYFRHYIFQNKFNEATIGKLQLMQYSLGDVDLNDGELLNNKPLHDTLKFFKSAPDEIEIPQDIDPDLKIGYNLVNVENLKKNRPELLQQTQVFFSSTVEHDLAVRKGTLQNLLKDKIITEATFNAELKKLEGN